MSCGVGHRHGMDPMLLWPVAPAPVQLLAWEPPRASGVALKRKKKKIRSEGKNKQVGPHQTKKVLHSKGNHQQNKKATY